MKTYLRAYFDRLKSLVLDKSQITYIVPADCYRLALEIKAVTDKSVSETTLKRVFGFASSIHQPSMYTLNALAQYCGFESWNDFYSHIEQGKLQASVQKSWNEIESNATKISLFTIQSNKHKCGIPYHLTIDREHVPVFMEIFHRSGATAGVLSGATGYGKTIAISRWVEKQISHNHTSASNDIYLFTNSLSLLQGMAFGYHCNRWLAQLLGFDTGELLDNFMETYLDNAPGNFYLIIDELHADLISDRQFHTVIGQLIEMVSHFARYKWFRVVLIMRTVTLRQYESLFRDTIINPQWFSIFSGTSGNRSADIPPFSTSELYQLVDKMNGNAQPLDGQRLQHKPLICIPLFFQYHYELAGTKLNPNQITSFDEYLATAQHIKRKIFNGINTIAKQAMMDELSAMIEEKDSHLQINKKHAYSIVRQYRSAYNDLLHAGVLQEMNSGLEIRQHTAIHFQSDCMASYFVALRLYTEHKSVTQLIQALDQSAYTKKTKSEQLKWLLLFFIESGNLQLVNQFPNISFVKDNQFEIIAFVCDGIDKLSRNASPAIKNEINLELSKGAFLEYTLNHTCFQAEYESNIEKLLNFHLSDAHEIILRSKLATIALLKWDENTLRDQLEALSMKHPDNYTGFAINPFSILSYLYRYFKDEDVIDGGIATKPKTFPLVLSPTGTSTNNQLFDLLVYLLVKVTDDRTLAHRYSINVKARLDQLDPSHVFERDFTSLIYALYLLECNELDTAFAYAECGTIASQNNLSYQLLHAIFHMQAGRLRRNDNYHEFSQRAITICESYGFKLLEAYCRIRILEVAPKEEQVQHINNLKFQFAAFGYTIGFGALSRKYD